MKFTNTILGEKRKPQKNIYYSMYVYCISDAIYLKFKASILWSYNMDIWYKCKKESNVNDLFKTHEISYLFWDWEQGRE